MRQSPQDPIAYPCFFRFVIYAYIRHNSSRISLKPSIISKTGYSYQAPLSECMCIPVPKPQMISVNPVECSCASIRGSSPMTTSKFVRSTDLTHHWRALLPTHMPCSNPSGGSIHVSMLGIFPQCCHSCQWRDFKASLTPNENSPPTLHPPTEQLGTSPSVKSPSLGHCWSPQLKAI